MQRQEGVTSGQEGHNRAVCKGTVELKHATAIAIHENQAEGQEKQHGEKVMSGLILTL